MICNHFWRSLSYLKVNDGFHKLFLSKGFLSYLFLPVLLLGICYSFVIVFHWPVPVIQDEFSYLLMADTFSSGQLFVEPHPMKDFFQTFHVIHNEEAYASKYFPGIGLQLAFGQFLGNPIIGVWLTVALFGCVLYWMISAFIPMRIGFPLALVFSIEYAVFSYMGHTFWGGSLFALAGALTLAGTLQALEKEKFWALWLSGLGVFLMMINRPFEGFFYALPIAGYLFFRKRPNDVFSWFKRLIPWSVCIIAGLLFMAIYNYTITGSALNFPHSHYQNTYTSFAYRFAWDSEPLNDQSIIGTDDTIPRPFKFQKESFLEKREQKKMFFWTFKWYVLKDLVDTYVPLYLTWMLFGLFIRQSSNFRILILLCCLLLVSRIFPLVLSWSSSHAHYSAAWIAPISMLFVFGLKGFLDAGKLNKLLRPLPVVLLLLFAVYYGKGLFLSEPNYWMRQTSYVSNFLVGRNIVQDYLNSGKNPSNDLVMVAYGDRHIWHREWVYNSPDINQQKIVWAHFFNHSVNKELIDYFEGRSVWLVYVNDSLFPSVIKYEELISGNKAKNLMPEILDWAKDTENSWLNLPAMKTVK